jgi:hypothetical protein
LLPAAALQRIRSEISEHKPAFGLDRADGAELSSRFIDRFECPLGAVWMAVVPTFHHRDVVLSAEEELKGHIRVGQRILNFSTQVIAPQATLEGHDELEHRVVLLREPNDFSEVQRRRWHRVDAGPALVGDAALYFEASRVIAGDDYEVRRGMQRTAVKVLDISGGGISFEASAGLGHELQTGDLIRLRIELQGDQDAFGFSAEVRNRQRTDSGGLRYGVSFHGDDHLFGETSARALHLVFLLQADR